MRTQIYGRYKLCGWGAGCITGGIGVPLTHGIFATFGETLSERIVISPPYIF